MNDIIKFLLMTIMIAGCSQNSKVPGIKLQPGTSSYKVATKLSEIYPFINPEKNITIVDANTFTVTVGDVIDEINLFFPMLLEQITKEKDPEQVRELMYSIAEQIAKNKSLIIAARKENISIPESTIDSLILKFSIVKIKKEELDNYLISKNKTKNDIRKIVEKRELSQRYFNIKYNEQVKVSEMEIRNAYDNSDYLNLYHIFIVTQNLDNTEKTKKFNLIKKIKNMLDEGFSFSELAKKYSEDDYSSKYGGLMKGVRLNQFPPQVDDVIFELEEGAVSDIIETSEGYHLFKIIKHIKDIRKFEDVYLVYKSQVERDKRILAERKIFADLKEQENWVVNSNL